MRGDDIVYKIERGLPGAVARVEDTRGDGDHWAVYVTYTGFAGKSRVEQHKMVYATLGQAMHGPIHALAIHTYEK